MLPALVIPYYPEPFLRLGPVEIPAFRLTLVAAVLWGGYIMVTRACRLGMSGRLMFNASQWAVVFGFAGAHVAKLVMDYNSLFRIDPAIIFTSGRGIRSIGGLAGGLLGVLFCCKVKRIPWRETVRMVDVMAFAMPFAFMVGRLGCFLEHDHRGLPSSSWVAVQFPEGARYDLGLIECLFLIPVSVLFYWLGRRQRPAGLFIAVYGIVYGSFRIWLDTLHLQPMRFYEGAALMLMGVCGAVFTYRDRNATRLDRQSVQPAGGCPF